MTKLKDSEIISDNKNDKKVGTTKINDNFITKYKIHVDGATELT